jgi:hypothetical protein
MSRCELLERASDERTKDDPQHQWVSVVPTPASHEKRGDVDREDAQRFALMVREWTQDWDSERDRSYKLP